MMQNYCDDHRSRATNSGAGARLCGHRRIVKHIEQTNNNKKDDPEWNIIANNTAADSHSGKRVLNNSKTASSSSPQEIRGVGRKMLPPRSPEKSVISPFAQQDQPSSQDTRPTTTDSSRMKFSKRYQDSGDFFAVMSAEEPIKETIRCNRGGIVAPSTSGNVITGEGVIPTGRRTKLLHVTSRSPLVPVAPWAVNYEGQQ
jgi:hypothetical protein